MRIFFPACDDEDEAHPSLSHLFVRVAAIPRAPITFDFSKCRQLRPMGLVVLSGLVRLLRLRGVQPHLDIATMSPLAYQQFVDSGCRSHIFSGVSSTNATLFRHDDRENSDAIIKFLRDQWLAGARLSMSVMLRDAFISRLWEVYANAFEHGDSALGVYTCGEQASDDTLVLTVADFGPGIPENAARKLRRTWVPGDEALRWAFTKGTTTATNQRYPRGLGLDLLREFVEINRGCLDVYSHHGHGRVISGEQVFKGLQLSMSATIVQIHLNCDDHTYMFQQEFELQLPPPGTPLF